MNARESDRIRRYIRHPAGIPIDVRPLAAVVGIENEQIRDIGLGGLAFRSAAEFEISTRVEVRIPLVDPEFLTQGEVVWCRPNGRLFETGVRFLEADDLYTLRMVEQVCHIEHYRLEVARRESRSLSSDQAAAEWIRMYAKAFPEFRRRGGEAP